MNITRAIATFIVCTTCLAFGQPPASGPNQAPSVMDELDRKIGLLSRQGTTIEDVILLLGEPQKYVWGDKTFEKGNLPGTYIAQYSDRVKFVSSGGRIVEVRCEGYDPKSGFTWRGQIHLGSSLDEVLAAVGQPTETVVGKPAGYIDSVLYRDIDGNKGRGYYARKDRNVRFFFANDKVTALYLVVGQDGTVSRSTASAYPTHLSPGGQPAIVRQPPPSDFGRGSMKSLPVYDAKAGKSFQVDLRGFDVSKLKLSGRLPDLRHADFDSRTRWPAAFPEGFNPKEFMEVGKSPGLGVRQLHARGITGKGVGIGIIDQTLLVNHVEYADRLRSYEEIHNPDGEAQMHGPAVASIAVGKTVGVAPGADLYYIAETHGVFGEGKFDWDFTWAAKSIDRMLEINAKLPKDRSIRVISISVGWSPGQKGYEETMQAVRRASEQGVFVMSCSIEATHHLSFHGLGRDPLAAPDAAASYGPGSWWASKYWAAPEQFAAKQSLLVPMDSRCTASPTGPGDYVFYADGGWSWVVPWIAGLYALACEAQPDITPETFWAAALKTGQTIQLHNGGAKADFGTIANPAALIESLQRDQQRKNNQSK